jgi:hypothetical protein
VKRPALFRRHEVWLPTAWGGLVLAVVTAGTLLLVGRNLHSFLAPKEPVGARVLVVEGWMGPEELEEAIDLFRSRGYERLITTGGPILPRPPPPAPALYPERAALFLKAHGLPEAVLTPVPTLERSRDRTYGSAVAVRDWAKRSGLRLDAIDLVSDGPHARRTRLLYRLAFGREVKVGIVATRSYDYDAAAWWRSSIGATDVIEQAIGFAWAKCCFSPD